MSSNLPTSGATTESQQTFGARVASNLEKSDSASRSLTPHAESVTVAVNGNTQKVIIAVDCQAMAEREEMRSRNRN